MFIVSDSLAMIRAIRAQPGPIGAWGFWLNIPQIVGGVLFLFRVEAVAVLLAELVALAVAGQIHRRSPFSRLTGLCHLPWLVLLPWLLVRLATGDNGLWYAAWLWYVCITIAISLVFDVLDVIRWWRGDRRFAWASGGADPGAGG